MITQWFAYIPKEYQSQEIRWLRLSPDQIDTGGVAILLYKDISKSSIYDHWFENLDIAFKWAEKYYGIEKSAWRTRESLEQEGIHVLDEW